MGDGGVVVYFVVFDPWRRRRIGGACDVGKRFARHDPACREQCDEQTTTLRLSRRVLDPQVEQTQAGGRLGGRCHPGESLGMPHLESVVNDATMNAALKRGGENFALESGRTKAF